MVRDGGLCLQVQRAARTRTRRFDEALPVLELTDGQFLVADVAEPASAPGDLSGGIAARNGPHHLDRCLEALGSGVQW